MKIPYNIYYNHIKHKYLPKSPIIRNSPEVIEYIKEKYNFAWENKVSFNESNSWIIIGISSSNAGSLYPYIITLNDEDIEKYNKYTIKMFDYDFEAFKKYLNWALNLPKFIINGKFKNQE